MKITTLIALLLLAAGCIRPGSGKPYYVVSKGAPENCICEFRYKDKYGNWPKFHDSCHYYHIGDTIK